MKKEITDRRMIIVSNRLPYKIIEKSGKALLTQSSGGLVSSMVSYFQKRNSDKSKFFEKAQWVGTSDLEEVRFKSLFKGKVADNNFEINPVFLPDETKDKFYNGLCNDTIWPLFHYFPSYAKFNSDYFEHYRIANQLFCEKIVAIYEPGDVIWVHDYHLMLLPEMLRKLLPEASIGFFLHIPFPSFELFRIIPSQWKKDILTGLLGSDLIGFHTNDYMQHFLKSVQQTLGHDISLRKIMLADRTVVADAIPVSIDFNKFYNSSNNAHIYNEKNNIKKTTDGRQIIFSVDRLDYAKAITNRLDAFELFLEKHSEYRNKVTYIMVVVPSRDIITKYKENKREIERLVSSINGKYGNIGWTPIVYQYKSINFERLASLYFAADVALITPLRDGMNLVAKEFISTRMDKRGVLILSETAGAASELAEALIVNPTDKEQIAEAIQQALTMPIDEQMTRNETMQSRLRTQDVVKWVEDFISQLQLQKTTQENLKVKEITPGIIAEIENSYVNSERRLILLDYDGTLAPLVQLPSMAKPSEELIELLSNLRDDQKNEIILVSGRTKTTLDSWFEKLNMTLIAEHGGFLKKTNEDWIGSHVLTRQWRERVRDLFEFYLSRCYGALIEEKELTLAWHYRNAEKQMGFMRSRELLNELRELSNDLDFQVLEGNMVVEVRPVGINKGIAATTVLENNNYDFILVIGDDRTDEDMFKVLPETAFSIRVGLQPTHARYNLKHQRYVGDFLNKLVVATSANIENNKVDVA